MTIDLRAAIIDPLRRVLKLQAGLTAQQARLAAIIDPLRRVLKHNLETMLDGTGGRCDHRPAAKGTET